MANYQIYYVGTEDEVAHHAAPLQREIDVRIVDPADAARFAGPNDLAIFFSEHFHRFRDAWLQLSRKGCNTLYALDGILEWRNAWENRDDEPACPWTMRPVLSDKAACIGPSQARVLSAWGNTGKTEIVGIPRLDRLVGQTKPTPSTRADFRVLITTAKWPGFTPEQTLKITKSLQDLKAWLDTHPEINGRLVKPVWRLTGELDKAVGVANQLNDISGKELTRVLDEVDAVLTTPSTVMLEVMLADLPVALLDYTNSPRYVDAAWAITAHDQIPEVLEQLASPSSRRMFLQSSILHDALQCSEDATGRLVRLASEMIRIGHDCRTANQPVVFPAQILTPVAHPNPLNLQEMFPGRGRVAAGADVDECVAVAAESLRRVNHLEARIELLENELEKAADGFQRIASHPVLAPLLKVRKLATRMGGRIAEILSMEKKSTESQPAQSGNVRVKT